MINRLPNNDLEIAKKIRSVFLVSYAVEAKLLNASSFPPLHRRLENYSQCSNDFFGYTIDQELGGIIEIKHEKSFTHIQSLVVHPKFFRKGIAKKLMAFVLNSFHNKPMVVETGVKNIPAIKLYKKFKFIEVNQWETNHGVRKIKFVRNTNNELNKRS
ncbi:MAG: N-acetyltransferase [Saprospiraceae bacterium]|nr:N-acetyltransferase [Saprospiraceae bacterium]MDG2418769.1 N-acetyltransferase [Saprospiraceae bacterium]